MGKRRMKRGRSKGKYIIMRKRVGEKVFKAFDLIPRTLAQARQQITKLKEVGAEGLFRAKRIADLKLREVANLTKEDIERLWRAR